MTVPESREPSSQPPAGKKFPCLQCGAKLDFNPAARGLRCGYCGFEQKVDTGEQEIREHDLERFLADGKGKSRVQGRTNEVQCGACGAVVLLEDKVATETCPYCANHLDNQPHEAETMIPPEAIVPFALDPAAALAAFRAWLKSLWYAPSELVQVTSLGQCSGVYVPYWTFDAMTYTRYSGQRGDDYTTTETYTETETTTNAAGQTESRPVTRTRNVTRTSWSSVSGDLDHYFDDVLIPASETLPPEFRATFHPGMLEKAEPFRAEYLAGFVTERYTLGPREGYQAARAVMEQTLRELVKKAIGGNHQKISNLRTQHVGVSFKQVLLPIYLASYRYRDHTYRVMVNGLTGEVLGDRPYSWKKIFALILTILTAIAAIVTLFVWLAHR